MRIRLPDRGEWIHVYMSTHPDPGITEERAGRAYDLWIAALERGQLIRERRAVLHDAGLRGRRQETRVGHGFDSGRMRELEERHDREIRELNPTYRPGSSWPSREAQERQRESIAFLFQEAQDRVPIPGDPPPPSEQPREARAATWRPSLYPSLGGGRRPPPSSRFEGDRGYVPDFAVDEDTRQREGNDDETN